jgi:hypothetical protein
LNVDDIVIQDSACCANAGTLRVEVSNSADKVVFFMLKAYFSARTSLK